jgi:hypothetical protein
VISMFGGTTYLGVGVGLGYQQGRGVWLAAHPHFKLWRQLHGLVVDGVGYARHVRDGGFAYTPVGGGREPVQRSAISHRGKAKTEGRQANKEKTKDNASSGRRRHTADKKSGEDGLGEMHSGGTKAAMAAQPSGQTAEERWEARQLEERSQQGVHSSQAKVTVIGRQ